MFDNKLIDKNARPPFQPLQFTFVSAQRTGGHFYRREGQSNPSPPPYLEYL